MLNTFVYFWPGTIDEPKPPRDLASSFRDKYRDFLGVSVLLVAKTNRNAVGPI